MTVAEFEAQGGLILCGYGCSLFYVLGKWLHVEFHKWRIGERESEPAA